MPSNKLLFNILFVSVTKMHKTIKHSLVSMHDVHTPNIEAPSNLFKMSLDNKSSCGKTFYV
jgi:hypothetical protein